MCGICVDVEISEYVLRRYVAEDFAYLDVGKLDWGVTNFDPVENRLSSAMVVWCRLNIMGAHVRIGYMSKG
jgi:hypothetical protein